MTSKNHYDIMRLEHLATSHTQLHVYVHVQCATHTPGIIDPLQHLKYYHNDVKTVILNWLQNDGSREFSVDQL